METKCLPLDEAIRQSTKQNIERDIRSGYLLPSEITPNLRQTYEDEAREILRSTGANYLPEFSDHPHITVR